MNTAPHSTYADSHPVIGDEISYKGRIVGTVTRVEGSLCWHTGDTAGPFIWCFNDGLNALHSWSRKVHKNAPCPRGLGEP